MNTPKRKERERNLQRFLLAASIVSEEVRAEMQRGDFEQYERSVLANIQEPEGGVGSLDAWLIREMGVERQDGEKVLDACKRQLARDAELRAMETVSHDEKWTATMIRFHEACERRRSRMKGTE